MRKLRHGDDEGRGQGSSASSLWHNDKWHLIKLLFGRRWRTLPLLQTCHQCSVTDGASHATFAHLPRREPAQSGKGRPAVLSAPARSLETPAGGVQLNQRVSWRGFCGLEVTPSRGQVFERERRVEQTQRGVGEILGEMEGPPFPELS